MTILTDPFSDLFSDSSHSGDSGMGSNDFSDAWNTACLNQIPAEANFGDLATQDYVDTMYWRDDS